MLVAAAFRREGFEVAQGDYFEDPQTHDPREIDIFAQKEEVDKALVLRVSFIVECKSSRRAPWVLFTGLRRPISSSARMLGTVASKNGASLLMSTRRNQAIRDLPIFTRFDSPAYGLTLGLRDNSENHDTTFEAAMKVAKAAAARASQSESEESFYGPTAEIIFPVIVTAAPLFEAYLDEKDQLTTIPVERSTLVWRNPGAGRRTTLIEILTADHLEGFVKEAGAAVTRFFSSADTEVAELARKIDEKTHGKDGRIS